MKPSSNEDGRATCTKQTSWPGVKVHRVQVKQGHSARATISMDDLCPTASKGKKNSPF